MPCQSCCSHGSAWHVFLRDQPTSDHGAPTPTSRRCERTCSDARTSAADPLQFRSKSPMRSPTNSCDGWRTYPMKIWLRSTDNIPSVWSHLSWSQGARHVLSKQARCSSASHSRSDMSEVPENILHSQQHDVPLPSPLQPTGHITVGTQHSSTTPATPSEPWSSQSRLVLCTRVSQHSPFPVLLVRCRLIPRHQRMPSVLLNLVVWPRF